MSPEEKIDLVEMIEESKIRECKRRILSDCIYDWISEELNK